VKKIFISGNLNTGKQTILYLLDNHPNIISQVIHDKFINTIIDLNYLIKKDINQKDLGVKIDNEIIEISNFNKEKTFLSFNKFKDSFNTSNIKRLEYLALFRKMPNHFSSIKKKYLEFNFDYENFVKVLKNKIFKSSQKKFTIENIFDLYIHSFIDSWNDLDLKFKDLKKINFATKLPNNNVSVKFILKENFDSKIIYVDRELLNILKSRALNTMVQNQIELKYFDIYFHNQLRTDFIERVKNNKREILKLKKNYDNIYITSLEKLTSDTKSELKKIYSFLNLPNSNLENIQPTYCGKKIGTDHINEINDDKFEISNKNYIFYLFRTKNFYDTLSILFKNLNYLNLFFISIYLKFKYKKNITN